MGARCRLAEVRSGPAWVPWCASGSWEFHVCFLLLFIFDIGRASKVFLVSVLFLTGKLHFVKFETAKVDECIAFIEAKGVSHSPCLVMGGRPVKLRTCFSAALTSHCACMYACRPTSEH